MKQNIKIGMSLALATVLSLGVSGCSSSDNNNAGGGTSSSSSAVDITVERGKVYDAKVTDSSTPAQVAIQKLGKNIYTFAKAPTYPVMVNGGWIDVNGDGTMDAGDVKLDIEMKSYSTTVTPITTLVADANETLRNQKLQNLAAELNAQGIGAETDITVSDLLKVPSDAPRDVFVAANAIYKDMKENNGALPDEATVISQFNSIDTLGSDATAKDFEMQVINTLITSNFVDAVSEQDILDFETLHNPTTGDTTAGGTADDTTAGGNAPTDLSGYSTIIIYKNASEAISSTLGYQAYTGFGSATISAATSCGDYGFTTIQSETNYGNISVKSYMDVSTTDSVRFCTENDYKNAEYGSGSNNIIMYYSLDNM